MPEPSEGRVCGSGETQLLPETRPRDVSPRMGVGEKNRTSLFSRPLIPAGACSGQTPPKPADETVQVMAFIGYSSQSSEKGKEG